MYIPNTPIPDQPEFLDKPISEAQTAIKSKLDWLNYAFGRTQRLTTDRDGKNYIYPAVHIGDGTYISVLPDQNLGNFCFFTVDDPQALDAKSLNSCDVTVKVSLVFWFDLSSIFPTAKDRNTEALKAQVLNVLSKLHLKTGRLTIKNVYEQAENIFKGYSLNEINTQYLMQPFGGFRFECELKLIQSLC